MSIDILTKSAFARELGYVDEEGTPSKRTIAQLLRNAIGLWGISPKRAVLKYARDELRAADVAVDSVPQVLERLISFGECVEVSIEHDQFIVGAEPRWIAIGGGRAVLLGPLALPTGVIPVDSLLADDIAIRVELGSEDMAAALDAAGARQVSLEEWLHPTDFLRNIARREWSAVRSDQWDLPKYWDQLVSTLCNEGHLLGPDAQVRALVGAPGDFFGRYSAETVEGRWRENPPDGIWCAYRRAHGDNRWLPTMVSVEGEVNRALDLFDSDEWRWALLARSKALGITEVVTQAHGEQRVTWPLPAQLRAAMDIIGIPAGPWRWQISEDGPDLWSLLS